jgi:hypothetical protein
MFGCILAYLTELVVNVPAITASALAFGTCFGVLGSAVSNPMKIKLFELLLLSIFCFLPTVGVLLFTGSESLFMLLLTSFVIANLAASLKTAFLALGLFKIDLANIAVCNA